MGQTGQRLYEGFRGWGGMSKERSNANPTSVLQPDNPFIHLQRTCCELAVHNMYSAYRKIFQKGILKSANTSSVHKLMMCMRISKHIV